MLTASVAMVPRISLPSAVLSVTSANSRLWLQKSGEAWPH
jgi:hypothetical protein